MLQALGKATMGIHIFVSIAVTAQQSIEILRIEKKAKFAVGLAVLAGTAKRLGILAA